MKPVSVRVASFNVNILPVRNSGRKSFPLAATSWAATTPRFTDKKIRGPGIKGLLKAFNNFESHKTWCIDSGPSENGFGVQLVIVWDGEIPPAEPQVLPLSKTPVKKAKATVSRQKKITQGDEELEAMKEPEVVREYL